MKQLRYVRDGCGLGGLFQAKACKTAMPRRTLEALYTCIVLYAVLRCQ